MSESYCTLAYGSLRVVLNFCSISVINLHFISCVIITDDSIMLSDLANQRHGFEVNVNFEHAIEVECIS